jgi:hypothetical protein
MRMVSISTNLRAGAFLARILGKYERTTFAVVYHQIIGF